MSMHPHQSYYSSHSCMSDKFKIDLPQSIASDAPCGADVPFFYGSYLRLPSLLPRSSIPESKHKLTL